MADLAPTAANVLKQTTTTISRGTAGEAITAGMSVYLKSSDGKIWKADANVTNVEAECKGVALNTAATGQEVTYATGGKITLGTVTAGAAGVPVCVSTTAGGLCPDSDIVTGNFYCFVGVMTSATELLIPSGGPLITGITHA